MERRPARAAWSPRARASRCRRPGRRRPARSGARQSRAEPAAGSSRGRPGADAGEIEHGQRPDPRAWAAGIRSFIVLDLARVGARAGPETEPARRLRARLPDAEIVLGGGVRGRDDLLALAAGGYQAALVGTALHTGVLGPADLSLRG